MSESESVGVQECVSGLHGTSCVNQYCDCACHKPIPQQSKEGSEHKLIGCPACSVNGVRSCVLLSSSAPNPAADEGFDAWWNGIRPLPDGSDGDLAKLAWDAGRIAARKN